MVGACLTQALALCLVVCLPWVVRDSQLWEAECHRHRRHHLLS
jgi:hypothetical protein